LLPNIRCEISIRPTSDQFLKALAKAPQLTQVRFMPTPLIPEQRTAPYLDTPKSGSFFPVLESLRARANLGVGCPFIIEELAPKVAPGLGEQTDDVLHELGFEATQINSLRNDGVVPANRRRESSAAD